MSQAYLKARRRETIKARISSFVLGAVTIAAVILGNATARAFTAFLFFLFLLFLANYFSFKAMGFRAFKKMADELEGRGS
ncbi:hypothetical protein LCGC14_0251870 [marine sediment metagenome]|uniref:Uncharacterized protein n=1 Tax=marine sediment metagenome TaxID=412755 RepID=A0A0F9U4F0_9ZZZZ